MLRGRNFIWYKQKEILTKGLQLYKTMETFAGVKREFSVMWTLRYETRVCLAAKVQF